MLGQGMPRVDAQALASCRAGLFQNVRPPGGSQRGLAGWLAGWLASWLAGQPAGGSGLGGGR